MLRPNNLVSMVSPLPGNKVAGRAAGNFKVAYFSRVLKAW